MPSEGGAEHGAHTSQIDAVLDGLELVEHVEPDPKGGRTVWFSDVESGEQTRQQNREMGTLLERAHFYGLLVTDIQFDDRTVRLQNPQHVEWYE